LPTPALLRPPTIGGVRRPASAHGAAVSLAGAGLLATGIWARFEVRKTLARERIVDGPESTPVRSAAAARSLAEKIRASTAEATDGRTYAETDPYLDARRQPTSDRQRALEDERSGLPVQNPEQALWLQSTTLQTALLQAYMGARLADLTVALGAAFLVAGAGPAAAAR
jgi:hypothetical protein